MLCLCLLSCLYAACNELNDDNGNFDYTNDQFIGSVATLTCNGGFSVSGTNPVTCQASEEWTGVPTCERKFIQCLHAITIEPGPTEGKSIPSGPKGTGGGHL